jgi:flagellar biosynthesis protein FlhB
MSDKTESPTPRRLRQARERGDTPASQAFTHAAAFLAVLACTPAALESLAGQSRTALVSLLAAPAAQGLDGLPSSWLMARDALTAAGPILLVAAATSAMVGLVQTGGVVTARPLQGGLGRLNPIEGLRGLFTAQRGLTIVRGLLLSTLICILVLDFASAHTRELAATTGELARAASVAAHFCRRLAWLAALCGLGLGAMDLWVSHLAFLRRNRMTKDEVRREHREAEGDPELRAARRRAHQELLAQATVSAVARATVLITNPTHLAVALRYVEDESAAPVVICQGDDELARAMIEAAYRYNIPVMQDVPLARALFELEQETEIPEHLYEAVAEILRAIAEADGG